MSLTKVSYAMIGGAYANVLDFGADKSGSADSSTAIQNAINSLGVLGGVVYFPPGTYKIASTVFTPSNSYGIWLLGSGMRNTYLQWSGGASAMIFAHSGTDNFRMEAFALENTGTGTVAVQLDCVRCNIIDIFSNSPVAWSSCIFSTVSTIASYNFKVIFDNLNLFVASNSATAQANYAIKLGSGHSVTIQNSMFSGFADAAIFRDTTVDTNAITGLSIIGCRFESFSGTSVPYPGAVDATAISLQYITGALITGCNFEMGADQVGSENQLAIYLGANIDGCVINGNFFTASGRLNHLINIAQSTVDALSITGNSFFRIVVSSITAVNTATLAKAEILNNIAKIGGVEVIVNNTFTPTVTIGGSSTGITYGARNARFVRYGKNLTYQVSVALTSKGALSGAVRIAGLPLGANSALTLPNFVGSVSAQNLASALPLSSLMTSDGAQSIRLYKADGNELQDSDITNTSEFFVQITVLTV
jgi:hypothetical protein